MEENNSKSKEKTGWRVLITGAGSYIGTSIEEYLCRYNSREGRERYRVDKISLREESWHNYDFSSYDVVFHTAGIAHADTGKVTEEEKKLYYRVNRDLAVETAAKAKAEGISLFIYMSSIIVYGDQVKINRDTQPSPSGFYGDSKLQAEKALNKLVSSEFQVAVLRPPMIYGKGSRGNYPLLARIADKTPVFPKIENRRSMLYIENLAEFVRLLIESGKGGIYFPQNKEYANTSYVVETIGKVRGKRIWLLRLLNPFVYLAEKIPGKVGQLAVKAFGSLVYDMEMSRDFGGYQIYSLEESIGRAEGK